MTLLPGTATNGYTGAAALQSTDAGGTLRYIPCYLVDATANDGVEPVMLINNVAFAVNVLQGTCTGVIQLRFPFIAGLTTADFFSRLLLGGIGDTGASGYHTATVWADNLGGDTAKTYGRCKCAGLTLTCVSSNQASQAVAFIDATLISADPESVTVAALAAPSSGPLSQGKILGWGQSAFTGCSDQVGYKLSVATGLQLVPGTVPGTGAYPVLPKGIKLNTVAGGVELTQIRNPATALKNGTLTTAFGAVGAGVSMAAELVRMMNQKRMPGGINFVKSTYFLNSNDGSNPLAFSDL